MDLFSQVMQGLDDHKPLLHALETTEAVRALVTEYNAYSQTLFVPLPEVTGFTTGKDFKSAMRKLDADVQLTLLKKYSDVLHGRHIPPVESPEKVADRKLRHFLIKAAVFFAGAGFFLIAGAVIAFAYKAGAIAKDGAVTTTITAPAVEIAKLIFNTGDK
jgi:hypothetical protein